MNYEEIEGDLISLAQGGKFEVIVHGCNCFCSMGAGIAPQMAKAFGADMFPLEAEKFSGSIHKLGMIDSKKLLVSQFGYTAEDYVGVDTDELKLPLTVVNAYTQYGFGANHEGGTVAPLDYEALAMCMRKINHEFKGKTIGLPLIGCGLAGGNWERVKLIIQIELKDMNIVVVHYKAD